MKPFKVPKSASTGKSAGTNLIIGIVEASGSMTSVWPMVAEFWNKYIPAQSSLYHHIRSCSSCLQRQRS